MKKVYNVEVSFEMFVVAEDVRAAEKVARENANEAFEAWDANIVAVECRPDCYAQEDAIPWGEQEDGEEKTVAELLEAQAEAEREAEEKRRIEANQLKLFPVEVKP